MRVAAIFSYPIKSHKTVMAALRIFFSCVSSSITCSVTDRWTDSHLAKSVEDWSGQVRNDQDWSGLVRNDQDWSTQVTLS